MNSTHCQPSDDDDSIQSTPAREISRLLINLPNNSDENGEESLVGEYNVDSSLKKKKGKTDSSYNILEEGDFSTKRKGGWPKGKKRKLGIDNPRAPKAPTTGYVLFLNERRRHYKISHPSMPFTEVTKLLGNEWSNLDSKEKQKYLDKAEADKKRYREELRIYRHTEIGSSTIKPTSGSFSSGEHKTKSDISADTDKDSVELYCDVCDQFFVSLHNKKEHLYGKQHLQAVTCKVYNGAIDAAGQNRKYLFPSCSCHPHLHGVLPPFCTGIYSSNLASNVNQSIQDFIEITIGREAEIKELNAQLIKTKDQNKHLLLELGQMQAFKARLQAGTITLKSEELCLNEQLHNLRMVPALFGVIHFQR